MAKVLKCLNCQNEFKQRHGCLCCSKKCGYEYRKFKVISGTIIRGITVLKEVNPTLVFSNGAYHAIRYVKCKCHCGNIFVTDLSRLKKKTKSCGCIKTPTPSNVTHGDSKTHLYKVWNGIRQRCENENIKNYKNYGGRGVKVCDEWLTFEPFREWALKNGWVKGLHIDKDKIGNGLLYSPSMCCIITQQENNKFINRKKKCD